MRVAIYGAGPSGLIACEKLLENGHEVHLFDKMASPARKFLMAGRGGLNLTHSEPLEQFLTRYLDCPAWFLDIIRDYPPKKLVEWANNLGIETFSGSSGRIFPQEMKASPLLRAWLKRLSKVHFHFKHEFIFEQGFDATLLAMGGASWGKLGSDAAWVSILREKGILIHEFTSANCGFHVEWSKFMQDKYAGLPLKNTAFNGVKGEAIITHKGIEGGVIYALSNKISKEIEQRGYADLIIDLKPDVPYLTQKPAKMSQNTFYKRLGLSPAAIALMQETKAIDVKNVKLILTKPFPLERAISSRGGIDFSEMTQDLELKKLPRVFVAGEMLGFDAPTGGYLLQAAFATGVRAAMSIDKGVT